MGSVPLRRTAIAAAAICVVAFGVLCLSRSLQEARGPALGFLLSANHHVRAADPAIVPPEFVSRLAGARLIAINGRPLDATEDPALRLLGIDAGTSVTYRFRKGTRLFSATIPLAARAGAVRMTLAWVSFATGVCFALCGALVVGLRPAAAAAVSAFFLYELAALFLFTGLVAQAGSAWAAAHALAFGLLPGAALHFAASYPEALAAGSASRRSMLAVVYGIAALLGIALGNVGASPSLYEPLAGVVHLLLANAALLLVARVLLALRGEKRRTVRRAHVLLIAGGATAVVTPGLFGLLPSVWLPPWAGPSVPIAAVAVFPVLATVAIPIGCSEHSPAAMTLQRLSVLFFDAIESTFLIALVIFWFSQSWSGLTDEFILHTDLQARVDAFLRGSRRSAIRDLDAIDARVQTPRQYRQVRNARAALSARDPNAARAMMYRLATREGKRGRELEAQRAWYGNLAVCLVLASLLIGFTQAGRFVRTIQHWLLEPINDLAEATRVIAAGDLSYRLKPVREEELGTLAESFNAMTASLRRVQQRVERENAAREEAAGTARDAERRRLARELHDSVLQDLGAVKWSLEGKLQRAPEAQLQPVIDGLIRTMTEVRRVVDDLRQPDLSASISLGEALAVYADARTQGREIELQLDVPESISVPDWATRDVYRIAQEAITNAVRHGSPTHLGVYLYRQKKNIILEIADDGTGFDRDRVTPGSGLLGMEERAAAFGGRLEVITVPREGTIIQISIPAAGDYSSTPV